MARPRSPKTSSPLDWPGFQNWVKFSDRWYIYTRLVCGGKRVLVCWFPRLVLVFHRFAYSLSTGWVGWLVSQGRGAGGLVLLVAGELVFGSLVPLPPVSCDTSHPVTSVTSQQAPGLETRGLVTGSGVRDRIRAGDRAGDGAGDWRVWGRVVWFWV